MAGAIRVGAGRKSIEPGLKEVLVDRNHKLDDLFDAHKLVMLEKVKAKDKSDAPEDDYSLTDDGKFRYIEKTGVSKHKVWAFES